MYPLSGEVFARGLGVFGCDAQARALLDRCVIIKPFAYRNGQAAAGDVQVNWLLKSARMLGCMLEQYVFARDP